MGWNDRERIEPEDFQKMSGADFIEKLANFPGGKEYLATLAKEDIKFLGENFLSAKEMFSNDPQKVMRYFIDYRHMPEDVAQAIMYKPSPLEQAKIQVTEFIDSFNGSIDERIAAAQRELQGSPDGGIRHRKLDNAERQAVGGPSM